MKELCLSDRGMPIRIIFLFDETQKGIVLLCGNKSNDHRWYVKNIRLAEKRFAEYLEEK